MSGRRHHLPEMGAEGGGQRLLPGPGALHRSGGGRGHRPQPRQRGLLPPPWGAAPSPAGADPDRAGHGHDPGVGEWFPDRELEVVADDADCPLARGGTSRSRASRRRRL